MRSPPRSARSEAPVPVDGASGGFRDPKILLPFILITFIWGSTWIVIKDQLGEVPPAWSVTYRFVIAAAGMFALIAWRRVPAGLDRSGHLLAVALGFAQFFLNFNFVYAAEQHITSGLVAVVFALLLVPNSAMSWLFFRHPVTPRFAIGSGVALAGVALLFVQEMRASPVPQSEVLLGIALTLGGVMAASAANVMQVAEAVRRRPILSMLAWAMVYGVLFNALFAYTMSGPPAFEARPGYWAGLLYLGLIASALAFSLYFAIIRAVGPGRAAYSSVLVPIIAMGLSTIFENYVWSPLAAAGGILALAGLVIALKARRA